MSLVKNFVAILIAISFVFVGCKKDKEETTSTKLSMEGDANFSLPKYAKVGENLKLEVTGAITTPKTGLTYKWISTGIIKDTIKSNIAQITMPDSIATYSVSLIISAEGYYDRSITKSVVVVNPQRNGSLKGLAVSKDSIKDTRDNKWYYTVKIGNLEWFAENLKWEGKGSGYENSNAIGEVIGRLYTWNDATGGKSSSGLGAGVQGVCPDGWSLPTNEDWEDLANAVGTKSPYKFVDNWDGVGEKLMANASFNGSAMWSYTANFSSSNKFGWNAIPSGMCSTGYTEFANMNNYGFWWSATEKDAENANYRYIFYNFGSFPLNYVTKDGFGASVRCVRNIN